MPGGGRIILGAAGAAALAAALAATGRFLRFRDRVRIQLETTPDIRVTGYVPGGIATTVAGHPVRAVLLRSYLLGGADGAGIADALRARVPPVRVPPYELVRDRILPVLKRPFVLPPRTGYVPENRVMRVPFDDEVVIAYVIEGQFRLTFVTEGMLAAWRLRPGDLHRVALENLRSRTQHVLREIGGPRRDYLALDGFDATRLLVADLLIPPGVAEPVLAIPHEHALLVRDRREAAALRTDSLAASRDAAHPLTARLYRWTSDGPVPFEAS